jgi:hypothetical protein
VTDERDRAPAHLCDRFASRRRQDQRTRETAGVRRRDPSAGQGGPCPPTGKSTTTDYVYVMDFAGDKIRHMTKIWNAGWAMKELGWSWRAVPPGLLGE